jgi:hypothetical protein
MTAERSDVDIAREHEERERKQADEERERTQQADEEAKQEVEALEDDPPKDLEDWPKGKAKYETFGGPEHETSYEEAATSKLGPAEVRHREDGSVEVGGEEVDNPDDYKGEPIPGGPTDPDARGVKDREQKRQELAEEGRDPDDAPDPSETSHARPETEGADES